MTEKKPAAPVASDKTDAAKASVSVTDSASQKKPSPDKPSAKSGSKSAGKQTAANKASPKPFPWFKTILLLLLIAALAGSAGFGWMQWQQRMTLEDQVQRSLATLEAKLERQQQGLVKAGQAQSTDIDQLQKQLYSLRLVANRQA